MDSEFNCGAETGSLRVIKTAADIAVEEVTHECVHPEGHDGEHTCLNCGISWMPEVPC
jgi:hypothetical protein